MARYYVDNRFAGAQQAITTTYKTQTVVYSNTGVLRRGRCVTLSVGADGAPARGRGRFQHVVGKRIAFRFGFGICQQPNAG